MFLSRSLSSRLKPSTLLSSANVSSSSSRPFSSITRLSTSDPRMSSIVIHNDLVYLSGQVPSDFSGSEKGNLSLQVTSTLSKVDTLLEEAGTSKSNLISAQIWLKNMSDFKAMNEIWVSWIDPENKPVRACVEAPMASPDILFEVMVIAKK
ncbi:hypothetical protein TrVE_jg12118 [Triparma verrucosa]|uniref:Uncharacterized protein n=1 Tax=Triparma verrucosa TaxID=1606542 RepID=A0A9W7CBG0_9STRA|nr:hypothetical protein TrVE_jg12118 [Triparma verrucosa]